MRGRLADVVAAIRTFPDLRSWLRCAAELVWAVPSLLLVAYIGDLVGMGSPIDAKELGWLAATLFVAPALGEELLFRAALLPRHEPRWRWLVLSVALFVLWHPLQAVTIGPPWAGAFLNPWFLAAVAILGLALARMYMASRSIWPPVVTHWLVVLVWKAFLGGPF